MRDDPAAESNAARLLNELGTEDRDDDAIEADHRSSRLAAVREYSPHARLDEELRLRLTGPDTDGGALRFQWGHALLHPVEAAVSTAAGTPVQLEVTGISAGSTVIHARPVTSRTGGAPGTLDAPATSAASTGISTLTELLRALESESDVREWARLFDAVDSLSRALGKYRLDLGLTWYDADGGTRRARLSERGRHYVERLRQTRDRDQEITISGRITELRESGWVKVKAGAAKNAHAYDVRFEDPEELVRMRPGLGDNVHFRVRFRQRLDAVGIARSTEFTYLGQAAEQIALHVEG
ncbi:hypothetical protein E2C00_13100 [Streptomyces sp. WAC05374]|uniref:hypothetical protein n=1 Tax=Streptomyces sp. WAC05374 TaxID=2487420 RepID=UPI000F8607AF|nr:hypothetical protein [Streptomyces sp. WAC05374]RST11811.1 hypothetical protein EF905_24115 [Streptomyces sp. WAC05374]TDF44683.1 hypothetical protein E2B92_14805 [Streptomyces sp. WAC05374]TDF56721.1 hypothetical protein E2C00_13100 [Streptomyces sp. WAC05374]TDF59903.1 hypothetical protein E2C02_04370 [Streptomyces sp. WAC05374]